MNKARRALTRLKDLPVVRHATALRYARQFRGWPGAFLGVYPSFAEAAASAPSDRIGYDYPELGEMYADRRFRIFEADYPVLFWLNRLLPEVKQVFDFGGHVGLAYYGFEKYLTFPAGFTWTVHDVPSVLVEGEKLLAQHPRPALRFSSTLEAVRECDLFHASGALQYVETPLAERLNDLGARPRHLLLNKLPLYDGAPYVTLQNTIHSFNPYAVYSRAAFIGSLTALGYRLVDSWDDVERSCRPLGRPEHHVSHYTGLYLRLESAS